MSADNPSRKPQDAAGEEQELIVFLSDPRSYAEGPGSVEIVETHAARVFLVGRKAIKTKKRVRLPFLDFSTLALRHQALKRELDLNSDHAPGIYGTLVSIGRDETGALAFNTTDNIVDYALIMTRFDQKDLLARQAEHGPLPLALVRALADMVARYHRTLPPIPDASGARLICETVDGLASGMTEIAPPALASEVAVFTCRCREDAARLWPLLEARSAAGKVRRCHGDLHLGNIVLIGGHPTAFDALEFDETLATTDVLYDLAFLLMDLDVRGHREAANAVLNAYVADEPTGGEIEGLAAMPLFLAIRAGIRGMVALQRARQSSYYHPETADALVYIRAAIDYLHPHTPALIAVGGLSGTGKSTLAARLAPRIGHAPGALVLRTDIERKRLFEVPETQRLTPDHYSEESSDAVYASLYAKTARALAAGYTVIFDAVSAKPAERERLAEIAREAGADFHGLWLEAALETQIARVEAREDDPSDSDATVVRNQWERDIGPITWTRIDAGQSPEHTVTQARAALAVSFRNAT